jgi:glycosyltransferase involved in cell wall biosynthesis
MPVFNESSGIREFIDEIHDQFQSYDVAFYLIDDFSTDSTKIALQELALRLPVSYQRNERNLGHGPSTVRALQFALTSDCDFILAVDGDGQFHAHEMKLLADQTIKNQCEIGLGIRVRTEEPTYRKFTSWVTRLIVNMKTKSRTLDANTPLRFYPRSSLETLLLDLKSDNPIPNLYISAKVRKLNFQIQTLEVEFCARRGDVSESVSWGKSLMNLPSKRFIKFCLKSIRYWIKNSNTI